MIMRTFAWMVVAGGMAITPATAAIAAKVVVVRSVGPSAKAYPPGKALTDTSSIKLNSGDAVTLLGPNASRTLRGPGTFTASTVDRSSLANAPAAVTVRRDASGKQTPPRLLTSTSPERKVCMPSRPSQAVSAQRRQFRSPASVAAQRRRLSLSLKGMRRFHGRPSYRSRMAANISWNGPVVATAARSAS